MIPWTEIAGQFARHSGDLPIEEQVEEFLEGLPGDQTILVACSGGADSVFLVMMLLARLPDAASRLHLCHFNHGVRGAAADSDARFVADMAKALGLACSSGAPQSPLSASESALRAARYDWLETVYAEQSAGGLCLGHHADDVLESQLMAVLSGSGPAGLAAPLPVKRFANGHVRLRPLLGLRKAEIEECLRAHGIPWCEDATNADTAYTRNWIRRELVPLLEDRFPQNVYAGSGRTRRLMAESVEALDAVVSGLGPDLSDESRLPVGCLAGQPRAVIRRALLAWWLRHRPEERLESRTVDALVCLIETPSPGHPVSIGGGKVLLLKDDGFLILGPESPPSHLQWPHPISWSWASGPLYLPGGGCLTGERVQWDPTEAPPYLTANPDQEAWLAADSPVLRVRQWQPGDRYRPLGAPGSRKLQDLFTDAKLNREQKHRLPVILSGDDILWVPGFSPNHAVRVQASAISALKLTYIP
jgi:tRNA(Ile)-lysidine synthase